MIITMTPKEIRSLYFFSNNNKGNIAIKITESPLGEFYAIRKQDGSRRKNAKWEDITDIGAL